jgi:hypothetical protein
LVVKFLCEECVLAEEVANYFFEYSTHINETFVQALQPLNFNYDNLKKGLDFLWFLTRIELSENHAEEA